MQHDAHQQKACKRQAKTQGTTTKLTTIGVSKTSHRVQTTSRKDQTTTGDAKNQHYQYDGLASVVVKHRFHQTACCVHGHALSAVVKTRLVITAS